MRKILRIINSGSFAETFRKRCGFDKYDALHDLISTVASPNANLYKRASEFERLCRGVFTAGALWLNPSSVAMQLTSVSIGLEEVGKYWFSAVQDYWFNREESVKKVAELSGFMRNRAVTQDLDLQSVNQLFEETNIKRLYRKVREAGYKPMQVFDAVVAVPAWMAMYEKSIVEGMEQSDAVSRADEFVARTQGGSRAIDLSRVQLSSLGRGFYPFFSAVSAATNMVRSTTIRLKQRTLGENALAIATNIVLPHLVLAPLVRILMDAPWREDDDDDAWNRAGRVYLRETLTGPFGGVPILSDFMDAVAAEMFSKRAYGSDAFEVSYARTANQVLDTFLGAIEDGSDSNMTSALYRTADAVSTVFRLPVLKVYEKARKLMINMNIIDEDDMPVPGKKKNKRRD
jgi:hypothetical protein